MILRLSTRRKPTTPRNPMPESPATGDLYERIAARPGGLRDLACARLRRSVEVALDHAGLQVPKPGRLRVNQLAGMLHDAGYELEARVVRAGEPRRQALEDASDEEGEKLADAYDLDIQADALRAAADAWEALGRPVQRSPIGVWLRARADQLERDSEQIRDTIPGPPSACQIIDVDGEPVRIQADPDMPAEVRAGLEDVIRTVQRNHGRPDSRTLSEQETVQPDQQSASAKESFPLRDLLRHALKGYDSDIDARAVDALVPVVEAETAALRQRAEEAEKDAKRERAMHRMATQHALNADAREAEADARTARAEARYAAEYAAHRREVAARFQAEREQDEARVELANWRTFSEIKEEAINLAKAERDEARAVLREVLNTFTRVRTDDGLIGATVPDPIHPRDFERWLAAIDQPEETRDA